ncbi:hypothetical protein C7G43_24075 [Bradyrhizobium sp. MOS004]|nr:hypothetical protein C7G43_24075 [Bradyrhizobium sp. MOS004]
MRDCNEGAACVRRGAPAACGQDRAFRRRDAGTVAAPSAAIGKPAALYELKDQNTVTLLLRAQRNW